MFIRKVMIPAHRAIVYAALVVLFALCMLLFLPSVAVPLTAFFFAWLLLLEIGIQAGGFRWAFTWHMLFTLVLLSAPFVINLRDKL